MLVSTLKEERRSSTCTDDYEVIFFCVAGAPHVDFLPPETLSSVVTPKESGFVEWLVLP